MVIEGDSRSLDYSSVEGLGLRVYHLGVRAWDLDFRVRTWDLGIGA